MFASTLPIALCLVGLVYGLIMQRLAWKWLCYSVIIFVAYANVRQGSVHMQYVGIEVAAFGCLLTFLDPLRFVRNRTTVAARASNDI